MVQFISLSVVSLAAWELYRFFSRGRNWLYCCRGRTKALGVVSFPR